MGRNGKARRFGQLEHVRVALTCYPANTHFRRLVVACGRRGTGRRVVQLSCSVRYDEDLRLMLDVLILWARQNAHRVWLDESVLPWLGAEPARQRHR